MSFEKWVLADSEIVIARFKTLFKRQHKTLVEIKERIYKNDFGTFILATETK